MSLEWDETDNRTFFKWEEQNHGLDHKCAICKTVLSSQKAKRSCIGAHEFPCPAYHNTLHREGQERNCLPCRVAKEKHHNRIRDMVTLDNTARTLYDDGRREDNAEKYPSDRRRSSSSTLTLLYNIPDAGEIAPSTSADIVVDNELSSSSTEPISTPSPKDIRTSRAATRKAMKAEKTAKRAKDRSGNDVTHEDVQRWEAALHPDRPTITLRNNEFVLSALAYQTQFSKYSKQREAPLPKDQEPPRKQRKEQRATKDSKPSHEAPSTPPSPFLTPTIDARQVDPILAKLDIASATPRYASKEGRPLLAKLKEQVAGHLAVTAFEDEETMKRMGGFFRYVNRVTYDRLVEKVDAEAARAGKAARKGRADGGEGEERGGQEGAVGERAEREEERPG
ncbi:hypothetical protein MMC13_001005 [Lambiella insularis]|nr:hypothetical protein [Lambiella insularis]